MKKAFQALSAVFTAAFTAAAATLTASAQGITSAPTGDIDNPIVFVIIGGIALVVIVVMTVLSFVFKKRK